MSLLDDRYASGNAMTDMAKKEAVKKAYRNAETFSNIMTARVCKGLNCCLLHLPGQQHDSRFPLFDGMPPLKDK
jgi:hypothetical protein